MKICSKCKVQKEDLDFYVYKCNSDGLSSDLCQIFVL